ncbi:hypothetical protein ACJVC5_06825 [Peredibacter sp. HCB2-198]|uniref:hypothetical protein n=1 Tax=Peredibacter sp. HCB2-198 TaxID=3383025 RepID=UPI0038B468E3
MMVRILLVLTLLLQVSCATKYIVPGNRFLTPESQGQALRGQIEIQQTNANQLTIDTSQGTVDQGVVYDEVSRTGFLASNSIFDQLDVYWSHIGGANSLVGLKFQFLGDSRVAKTAGHKMSIAAALGENEHETDDQSVEFNLGGREFMLLYGYRFSENVMTYSSFSMATYKFDGDIRSSDPGLNGADPKFDTKIQSLSAGLELSWATVFGKLEGTYQQLKTTDTKDKNVFIVGYSVGMSW